MIGYSSGVVAGKIILHCRLRTLRSRWTMDRGCIVSVSTAALALAALLSAGEARAAALIGDPLPNVTLHRVDPGPAPKVKLHDLGHGVLVFSFYSKSCRPCRMELPALHRAVARVNRDRPKRTQVRVVVLVIDEPPPTVVRKRLGAKTLWLLDVKGAARRTFVPRRYPCTYIAKAKRIRKINRGFGRGYERRIEGWLRGLTK